jgi:hypothetical protein
VSEESRTHHSSKLRDKLIHCAATLLLPILLRQLGWINVDALRALNVVDYVMLDVGLVPLS